MAAYDPKRPRPAQLSDDPAPVEALLAPTVVEPPEPVVVHSPTRGSAAADVPVAAAPEVGTANRAVLYASIGVAAVLAAVLIALRVRSRRATASTAD